MSEHYWNSEKFQKPGGMAPIEEQEAYAALLTTGNENESYLRIHETPRGTLFSVPADRTEWRQRRLSGVKVA